jgi:hypothetical protein
MQNSFCPIHPPVQSSYIHPMTVTWAPISVANHAIMAEKVSLGNINNNSGNNKLLQNFNM